MSGEPSTQSLLPYLDRSGRGIYLEIPLTSTDPVYLERQDFPFKVVDASHPLFRVIEARFRSDAGSRILNVFLVLQKDVCTLPVEALKPINNIDIDAAWLRAVSACADSHGGDLSILLSSQFDRTGKPVPFRPLFFCKRGSIFFHPPCPSCGSPLAECRDDNLLGQWDLPPHSTSTSRFLFCPSCSLSREEVRFFTSRMEGWEVRGVEDWRNLAREYARLREKSLEEAGSPCHDCPKQSDCRNQEGAGETDFVPFSFYPFFMIIHEAMSCNALDFLALLSDASFRDVRGALRRDGQMGRLGWIQDVEEALAEKQCFLFRGEKRHFLEILYLKLSFLDELARLELTGSTTNGSPDWRPSLDRVWVKFTGQAALLPQFWNFSLRRIGVVDDMSPSPLPLRSSFGRVFHFLGLAWFYALLRNGEQGAGQVHGALRDYLSQSPDRLIDLPDTGTGSVFGPQNNFWNPKDRNVDESWHPLWNEALQLGMDLIRPVENACAVSSMEVFRERLAALQQDIRKELFEGRSIVQPVDTGQADETICAIIKKLRDSWSATTGLEAAADAGLKPSSGEWPPGGDGMLRIEEEGRPAPMAETVLEAAAEAAGPADVGEQIEEPAEAYHPLPETVMLQSGEVKPRPAVAPVSSNEDEEVIPETMILSPVREEPVQANESDLEPPSHADIEEPEGPLLPETVLLKDLARPESRSEEEALPETVIIGARSGKNGRKKEEKK